MSGKGRVAVVTGASSGIGRASAVALSNEGWKLVLSGRRQDALQETASLCKGETLICAGDVCVEDDVVRLFSQAADKFGRIDLLFNNAGVSGPGVPIEDHSLADWKAVLDTNLTAVFLCTREAVRHMKKTGGGRIINNGSVSAHVPRPNSAPYTATKHAVLGMTRSTALDGRKYNIACSQIDIGNADTSMGGKMAKGVPQANGSVEVEPVMDVSNVSNAIVYLASLPEGANVLNMTLMASNMPFVGRG